MESGDGLLFSLNDLGSKHRGLGIIVEGQQPEAFRQAAIDRFGMSRIHMMWAHPTMHGNRILVRTKACMYCFGDGEWKPPPGDPPPVARCQEHTGECTVDGGSRGHSGERIARSGISLCAYEPSHMRTCQWPQGRENGQ